MNKTDIRNAITEINDYEIIIFSTLKNDEIRKYSEFEYHRLFQNKLFLKSYYTETKIIFDSYKEIVKIFSNMINTSSESDIYAVFTSYVKEIDNSEFEDGKDYLNDTLEFLKEVSEIVHNRFLEIQKYL